ncbi:cytidylate kinase-like family protein [Desulforegula conservatrix]|uniref:cytidylate kinase-like family protein n=1 Tax=Desulforegula conservatrix TaxID=153026 RepID=UPI0003F872EE|nr:cytidylate kinase-like family protein [Desulforegula conservatrix]
MAIITISRGCCSRGKEVAELVAKRLKYACISREILLDASEIFHVSELKLRKAIHDVPSLIERFTYGRERCLAYIEAALLQFLSEDNIVYHGLAGHFLVRNIPNVLKVRIVADMNERIRLEMERENVSAEEAEIMIRKNDDQRIKWSTYLYGVDTSDSSLYDLIINLKSLNVEDAADIICEAVKRKAFETNNESLATIRDIALVKAAIMEIIPDSKVTASDGQITIKCKIGDVDTETFSSEIRKKALSVKGVKNAKVVFDHVVEFSE